MSRENYLYKLISLIVKEVKCYFRLLYIHVLILLNLLLIFLILLLTFLMFLFIMLTKAFRTIHNHMPQKTITSFKTVSPRFGKQNMISTLRRDTNVI